MVIEHNENAPAFRIPRGFWQDPRVSALGHADQVCLLWLGILKSRGRIPGMTDAEVASALRLDPYAAMDIKRRLVTAGLVDESWDVIADWALVWPLGDRSYD